MATLASKPIQVAILVAFGIFALIGLFLFASYGGGGAGRTSVGAVEIWGTLPQIPMDAAVGRLRASNRDFEGVTYREIPATDFDRRFTEALATGTGPDLVIITQEQIAGERAKLALIPYTTLSERDYLDTFVPIAELFLSADGTYGVPLAVDPLVLFYNRALLAQAGIPNPPVTWEGLLGMTESLTVRQGTAISRSAVPFGTYRNAANARATLSLILLQAGSPMVAIENGELRSRLGAAASGSLGIAPAEAAIAFYTQFADPAKRSYTWNPARPAARDAFLTGDLVFYPGFASEIPSLAAANPNLNFDIVAMPQPQNATSRTTYALTYAVAIPRSATDPAAAVRTARALTDAVQASVTAAELSMAPAQRSALGTASALNRYASVFVPQALIARGWLSPDPSEADRVLGAMIDDIMSGRRAIGDALTVADRALDAALAL